MGWNDPFRSLNVVHLLPIKTIDFSFNNRLWYSWQPTISRIVVDEWLSISNLNSNAV